MYHFRKKPMLKYYTNIQPTALSYIPHFYVSVYFKQIIVIAECCTSNYKKISRRTLFGYVHSVWIYTRLTISTLDIL